MAIITPTNSVSHCYVHSLTHSSFTVHPLICSHTRSSTTYHTLNTHHRHSTTTVTPSSRSQHSVFDTVMHIHSLVPSSQFTLSSARSSIGWHSHIFTYISLTHSLVRIAPSRSPLFVHFLLWELFISLHCTLILPLVFSFPDCFPLRFSFPAACPASRCETRFKG